MRRETSLALMLGVMAIGCSERSRFEQEIEVCTVAERQGIPETAISACGRALEIADSAGLSPELTSRALYLLGRLKRQQGDFLAAEQLLSRSLRIEEQREKPGRLDIGQRLIELSLSLAGQKRWDDGARILERLTSMAGEFPEKTRTQIANILRHYSMQLGKAGQSEMAERLQLSATALQQ